MNIIRRLKRKEDFVDLLEHREQYAEQLANEAREQTLSNFGDKIFVRGLIEFTNYCKNDCYYCGIRAGNGRCERYRLSEDEILDCAKLGHKLGYRTFVLQGGEDPFFSDDKICRIVERLKSRFPDTAITLSIGEKSRESYQSYFDAGADRYLLRHETADDTHYGKLHPAYMSLSNRKQCLYDLKEIGFQTGAGFMVGSPFQTYEHIAADLMFLAELKPEMVGIGPFIRHKDTMFADYPDNNIDLTLFLLSVVRLMLPYANIPATTAVATLDPLGREKAVMRGANVVMPNLSPIDHRKKYLLYDDKVCTGDEAAECDACMRGRMKKIGMEIVTARGDYCG